MPGLTIPSSPTDVRALNDAFRRSFTGGRVVVTAGVAALPDQTRTAVLAAVRSSDAFTTDDDPHDEHDFGAVEVWGRALLLKDRYLRLGACLRFAQSGRSYHHDPCPHCHARPGILTLIGELSLSAPSLG